MGTHYNGKPREVRALDAYVKLMRSASTVQDRLDLHLKRIGLKENQLGVLEMLLHLGPQCQSAIGRKLLLSRANITILVDQLAKKGLVRRVRDKQDRRQVEVHLTAEGRRRIEKVFPSHVDAIVEVFSVLDPSEQRELGRLCKKLGLGLGQGRQSEASAG